MFDLVKRAFVAALGSVILAALTGGGGVGPAAGMNPNDATYVVADGGHGWIGSVGP